MGDDSCVPLMASGWTVRDWREVVAPCFDRYRQQCRANYLDEQNERAAAAEPPTVLPRARPPTADRPAADEGAAAAGRLADMAQLKRCFFPRLPESMKASPVVDFPGLRNGVSTYHALAFPGIRRADADPFGWFLDDLLPRIVAWAEEFPALFGQPSGSRICVPHGPGQAEDVLHEVFALPLLEPVHSRHPEGGASAASATLTRRQCRCVLAASFLGIGPAPFLQSVKELVKRTDVRSMNTRDYDVGEIDWTVLFRSGGNPSSGPHRVACQVAYFHQWAMAEDLAEEQRAAEDGAAQRASTAGSASAKASNAEEDEDDIRPERAAPRPPANALPSAARLDEAVVFHRAGLTPTRVAPNWGELTDTPLVPLTPLPDGGRRHPPTTPRPPVHVIGTPLIEQFEDAEAHVDFANRQIQIGTLIPSATQEEVMFSIRPELLLALPLYTTILDHEAAGVTGAATFTRYTGYLTTFRYAGSSAGGPKQALHPLSDAAKREDARAGQAAKLRRIPFVTVMDAHVNMGQQFMPGMHKRDLDKAFVAFDLTVATGGAHVVATGPWGCGAFRGDVGLKLVQQLMAAAAASFSTAASSLSRHGPAPDFSNAAPAVVLRYHDGKRARVMSAIAGLLSLLDVSVAEAHRWVCDFALSKADNYPSIAELCDESQDRSKWPELHGEDPERVPPVLGAETTEVDDTGLVPYTAAWYWSALVEEVADGALDGAAFLAFVAVRAGIRLRDSARVHN